jgi:uncharacterized membrane protein YqjE
MAERETALPNTRSFAEIIQQIAVNIGEIIRSEVRLAKVELRDSALKASLSAGTLVAGAVLAFYALGFLLLTILFALRIVLPAWFAALIVGIGSAIAAVILVAAGLQALKRVNVLPEKTAANVKEDVQWMRQQIR